MENPNSSAKKTKTLKSRRESAVQGTNDCSIVSKCSMAALGYFDDPYLQCFVSKVTRRAPLIHRGYYVRAKTLDYILKSFLQENRGKKQIVSLGAGFDSAYFRLYTKNLLTETTFYEIDFPEVVKRKCALIKANPELLGMLGNVDSSLSEKSSLIEISAECYKLLGVDLSQLNTLEAVLNLCNVDLDAPTLLLSECVLTYMTRRCASNVVKWAGETFNNSMFVLYEQINPDDAFGLFMQHHFHTVGSPLKSINAFPTLQSQRDRFCKLGWSDVDALDMNQFYFSLLPSEERERIEKIEPFDEYEEWHLKCAHYMVLCGYHGECARLPIGGKFDQVETCSPNVTECGDVIQYTRKELVNPLRLFGHVTSDCGENGLVSVGGFGEQNGKHMRVTNIASINRSTLTVSNVNPAVDNTKIQVSRMHASLTYLKDGRLILIGGRLSPMKLCTQVVVLKFETRKQASSPEDVAMESDQSIGVTSCEGNVISSAECVNENCSKMNCNEKCMNCSKLECGSRKANSINILNEFSSDNYNANKENESTNCMLSEKDIKPFVNTDDLVKIPIEDKNEDAFKNVRDKSVIVDCTVINQTGDLPCPRWRHTAVLYDDNGEETVIIFGGRTQMVLALEDCYKFLPQTNEWTKIESVGQMPSARQSHSASLWNNHMIIAGGLQADLQPLSSIYMLNLQTQIWTLLPTNILPRYSHSAHVTEDFLILIGGVNCHHTPPGVAIVHLISGQSAEFPLPKQNKDNLVMLHRHTSVAMTLDTAVVLGGGGNCFSFGTHLNPSPFLIDFGEAIKLLKEKVI